MAMYWASSVTTIGLEFSLPVGVGFAVDRHWHTMPVATLIGSAVGFATGMTHILAVARGLSTGRGPGSAGSPENGSPKRLNKGGGAS
jgi:hypothetical protein